MRPITLIMAYYDNPTMLGRHIDELEALPGELRERIRVIIVDDGSPHWPAVEAFAGAAPVDLEIYRIDVDVRWNQDAARNIGVHHATTRWLLLTDIDHLVPIGTWRHLVAGDFHVKTTYRFSRLSLPALEPYKPHPNSWFLSRKQFERIGGYDERFAGYYGTDFDFRNRAVALGPIVTLPDVLVRVPREVIADASTTTYERKAAIDKETMPRLRKARDAELGWKPKRLTFPYHRVL